MKHNRIKSIRHIIDREKGIVTLEVSRVINVNVWTKEIGSNRFSRFMSTLTEMDKEGKLSVNWEQPGGSIVKGDWTFYISYPTT